jgi:acetyl-CoA carboxylase carboxyl transferase subunit beta
VALLHFRKPDNALEDGGRDGLPVQEDALEPELTCPECRHSTPVSRLQSRYMVCSCGYHFRMNARERIRMIVDRGTFQEMFSDVAGDDPLKFPGYPEKLETARAASGENEAVICGTGTIGKMPCAFFFMEPGFMMGSMGTAVGERITRTFELARERNLPVVGFTVSGGARMQEGLLSLMQMAKVSGAVRRPFRRRASVYRGSDRSDDWRCDGELRDAGGYHALRAGRNGRICREENRGTGDREKTAEEFSESRVG